jgi:hypothetical protein
VEIRGPAVDALGKIQIELWWGTQVTISEGDDLYEPPGTSEASLGPVHEKKMKWVCRIARVQFVIADMTGLAQLSSTSL